MTDAPQVVIVSLEATSQRSWGEGGSVKAMYAAVRRYEGVTDPKEVARQVEEHFLPILSEMPGFVAYYWVDAGDGVVVTTSVFEHKDAEEESSWRAGQFVAQHIAPLSPNPPQITAGDVVAHKSS